MQLDLEKQNRIISMLNGIPDMVYGFADVGDDLPFELKQLPYAVSIGIPLHDDIIDPIIAGPNQAYYDTYNSVNEQLDVLGEQIQQAIEQLGYHACAIASSKRTDFVNIAGDFPHKTSAVKSGLGWLGRSSLLITKKFGPRIRISTILTDMPLLTNDFATTNSCGKCNRCVEACPAQAIVGNAWSKGVSREDLVDVKKCDVWKIEHYPQFDGLVCGVCVAVCPHGTKKKA
ncbi:ferredoxin [Sporomusaceae bacterium FL31]|nr:ferredoxin [Sporomusaceae bacterium FL31]GCE34503.1 ferredoxin [Sporomusaceae bacterium]